jgi:hypothetical protein
MISRALGLVRAALQWCSFYFNAMTQTVHAETSEVYMSSPLPPLQPATTPYDEWLQRGPFPFLALPTEIRLAMYEAMFADSRLVANKAAAFEYQPPWGKAGHVYDEIRRYQILLSCHRCYDEGHSIFYGMTSWMVHGPEVALWEFGPPRSAFWSRVGLVKEMHIWGDEGAGRLRPAEFPALQRLLIHLDTSNPRYERDNGGAASPIPTSQSTDEDILTWIRTSADYKSFVKPVFDKQRKFIVSIVIMFENSWAALSSEETMVGCTAFKLRKAPAIFGILTDYTSFAMSILIQRSSFALAPALAK